MQVALVTGATRGIGKGIAVELGRAGYKVYVSGRRRSQEKNSPGSLDETVAGILASGGQAVGVECDHASDAETARLFATLADAEGRLDLLVNNASAFGPTADGYPLDDVPFWDHPVSLWDAMHAVGLRSHFVASSLAAPMMIAAGRGLIVNISSAGAAQYVFNAAYGAQKAALDKLTADMAHDLANKGVVAVSVWPPFTRTEKYEALGDRVNLTSARSPSFTGRVVAALASDTHLLQKNGRALRINDLAAEYGIRD